MITFAQYKQQFEDVLNGNSNDPVYSSADFIHYTKLNASRMKRWEKNGNVLPAAREIVMSISKHQNWVLITEPWCGDAAHIVPFIQKLAALNEKIQLTIQNRDNHSEIENYLTNGGKSIPILIVRDEHNKDLFVWGPRPKDAQKLFLQMKNDPTINASVQKENLQNWYNNDGGKQIQEEIAEQLKNHI